MAKTEDRQALDLFDQLIDLSEDQRTAYLDKNCADIAVKKQVIRMLAAREADAQLLDQPAAAQVAGWLPEPTPEPLPERIGAYSISRRIGEGGMAVVFEAQRADGAFDQRVALKLIHPSRLGEQWQERFLRERQILASLQHPNIAQLHDGGIADDGRPYFVLEFVDGLPITDYCDRNELNIEQRLALLLTVCDAVSHAHQNLVVHRDLKPGNILVDHSGGVKLLDFGIAKLLGDENSALTSTGQRAMTPDYASPEQFVGETITTATDAHALGALLYELLMGRRPYLSVDGSVIDIERQVLAGTPPSFSQLSSDPTVDDVERKRIANARSTSWRKLVQAARGDLENIARKALRREPSRRYPSAQALAEDIRRYVKGLPVQARADKTWYRIRKFIGRHQLGVSVGTIVAVALVATTGFAIFQTREAEREARRATEAGEFLSSLFEYSSPDKNLGENLTARQLLDRGALRVTQELNDEPALQSSMAQLLADTYLQLGAYESAEPLLAQALRLSQATADETGEVKARLSLSRLYRRDGKFEQAKQQLDDAQALSDRVASDETWSSILNERGELAREQAQFPEAKKFLNQALDFDRGRNASGSVIAGDLSRLAAIELTSGDNARALELMNQASDELTAASNIQNTQYAEVRHDLGVLLIQSGDLDQARAVLEEALRLRATLLGKRHPDYAATLKELAGVHRVQGREDEAEAMYLEALAVNEETLGPTHPETASSLNSLSVLYNGKRNLDLALEYAQRALPGIAAAFGDGHPRVAVMKNNIGAIQSQLGKSEEALATVEEARSMILASVGEEHQLTGVLYASLGKIQIDLGDIEAAEVTLRKALAIFQATVGDSHPHLLPIYNGLATAVAQQERASEAIPYFRSAIAIGEAVLPPKHPNLSVVQLGLAKALLDASNDCAAALDIADEHLPILAASGHADRHDHRALKTSLERCSLE